MPAACSHSHNSPTRRPDNHARPARATMPPTGIRRSHLRRRRVAVELATLSMCTVACRDSVLGTHKLKRGFSRAIRTTKATSSRRSPVPEPVHSGILRRPILGGLINQYEPAARNHWSRPMTEFWNPTGVRTGDGRDPDLPPRARPSPDQTRAGAGRQGLLEPGDPFLPAATPDHCDHPRAADQA